ncbi:MAG: recombination protein O N-terminal domain-containing protein [Bacteroidales bacterium]|nr:recombination protein O N-terminal domain-containing protein [Bacteroidales bacterium]
MKRPCEFIVLHTTKYAESAFVVHTLCRELGKRSFLVRGIGKSVSPAWFLQLNIVGADIAESTRSSLWTASHFSQEHPLSGLRENPGKNCIALFLAEVLLKTLHEGETDEAFYDWLRGRILLLDALGDGTSGAGYANFHIALLKELCERTGYSPARDDLFAFSDENYADLENLSDKNFEQTLLAPLSGRSRSRIARSYLKYLEYHLDMPLHIQSLDVLECLFR